MRELGDGTTVLGNNCGEDAQCTCYHCGIICDRTWERTLFWEGAVRPLRVALQHTPGGGSTGSSLQMLLEAEICIGINGDILPTFRNYCPSVLCIRALTATEAEL